MDYLFDRLFLPSRIRETSLVKKFTGSQNLLRNSNNLFQNIPHVYQQELFENSLFSLDFNLPSSPEDSKQNNFSLFGTFGQALQSLTKIQKSQPNLNFIQDYNYLLNNSMKMITVRNQELTYLIPNIFEVDGIHQKKEEMLPFVQTVSPKCKKSLDYQIDIILPKAPAEKVKISDSNSVKMIDCNLNEQLSNRKAKELKKRSKKRRKRQKKAVLNSYTKSDPKPNKSFEAISKTPPKVSINAVNVDNNCDILCDVTLSPDSKSVHITLPGLSSFLVTVESGADDDSDWDTAGDSVQDRVVDDSEFLICGLFVSTLTTNSAHSIFAVDKEEDLQTSSLREVNKKWLESNKDLIDKRKSETLVSFPPDDELFEIFPVEMYERKGEWELYALDRLRFQKRIQEMEEILTPCYSADHRAKMYHKLHESVL